MPGLLQENQNLGNLATGLYESSELNSARMRNYNRAVSQANKQALGQIAGAAAGAIGHGAKAAMGEYGRQQEVAGDVAAETGDQPSGMTGAAAASLFGHFFRGMMGGD